MVRRVLFTTPIILSCIFFLYLSQCEGEEREVSGNIVVKDGTVLGKDEVLHLLPGAQLMIEGTLTVKGKLILQGDEKSPAKMVMINKSGYGVVIKGGTLKGDYFSFEGASKGIESYSGTVRMMRGKSFIQGIHVNASGQTRLDVGEVQIEGGKVGIIFRSGSGGVVKKCRFSGQERAGIYVYGTEGVKVTDSRFSGSKVGIILSLYGTEASIENNRFEGNIEGIRVEKLARPRIKGNSFYRNRTGIIFSKRGRGEVTGNIFEDNEISIYVKYSSYPLFRGNDFLNFGSYAVRLENQSSEWEKHASDSDREESFGPFSAPVEGKGKRSMPDREKLKLPKGALTGKVDFRGNFWGSMTSEIKKKGPEGNITGIFDGRDMPEFGYKGKKYRMDTVDIENPVLHPFVEEGR